VLINVNITDIMDEAGYIDAIGQKAASQASQQARGDVAEHLRMGETRVAQAERDREIQVANAAKEKEIGTKDAMREQLIRLAELEKAQKVGEQTAAYLRDAEIKDAEREMRVRLADANAKAVSGENTAEQEIATSKASLAIRQAETYQLAETKKREAEAAVIEAANRHG
jgi:flotillin